MKWLSSVSVVVDAVGDRDAAELPDDLGPACAPAASNTSFPFSFVARVASPMTPVSETRDQWSIIFSGEAPFPFREPRQ